MLLEGDLVLVVKITNWRLDGHWHQLNHTHLNKIYPVKKLRGRPPYNVPGEVIALIETENNYDVWVGPEHVEIVFCK